MRVRPDLQIMMVWAKDIVTGEVRHIGELNEQRRGAKSGCLCLACLEPVIARKAGSKPSEWRGNGRQRPHFAHARGTSSAKCSITAGRNLLLADLLKTGHITLPRKRFQAVVNGISGQEYFGWIELAEEDVSVAGARLIDVNHAQITLACGRIVEVTVVAELSGPTPDSTGNTSIIQVISDDPGIVALPPDDLRKRLHLEISCGAWYALETSGIHYVAAEKRAIQHAMENMDWLPPSLDLSSIPKQAWRETILHQYAKIVLQETKHIVVPDLTTSAPSIKLDVTGAKAEVSLGDIRPDLILDLDTASPAYFNGQLSIEITVTHGISPERQGRIAKAGIPSLEICLDQTGGTITLTEFRSLLIENIEIKRWIYHPKAVVSAVNENMEVVVGLGGADIDRSSRAERLIELVLASAELHQKEHTVSMVDSKRMDAAILDLVIGLGGDRLSAKTRDYLVRPLGIMTRILSFKLGRPVGYRLETTWQVFNSLLSDQGPSQRWHPYYAMAIDKYFQPVSTKHADRVKAWTLQLRQAFKDSPGSFESDDSGILESLFPEFSSQISKVRELVDGDIFKKAGEASGFGVAPSSFAKSYAETTGRRSEDILRKLKERGFVTDFNRWT